MDPCQKLDASLRLLVPSRHRQTIRALLDNRASWSAIKHWRKGRRQIPKWVFARIADRLQPLAQLAADIDAMPERKPRGNPTAGNAYRARRARERDAAAKEKARD